MSKAVDRRVLTAALAASALVLSGVAVAGSRQVAEANDRATAAAFRLADHAASGEQAEMELTEQKQALEQAETQLRELRRYFSADAVAAVSQLQSEMELAACDQARTAVRERSAAPTAESFVTFAVAGGTASKIALTRLDQRWGRMLDPLAIQAQIDSCSTDERAEVEAERRAAQAQRQAAEAAERSNNCGAPLFDEGACPTDAELAAEQQAERLCGGARYEEAAALGIDCGVP